MQWDTILFDLDGTLTDSGPGIMNGIQYAVEKMGLPGHPRDFYRAFIGPPLIWSFENLLGLDEEQSKVGIKTYREYYTKTGIWENSPYPGVKELLEKLKKAGLKLGVATSKPEVMANQVLEHFELLPYFDCVCGASLQENRDQKAEAVGRCLEQLGGRAIMVGDRHHDIEGARKNNIPCIAVLYGYGSRQEFEEAGAAYIVENIAQLDALLLG